MTGFAPKVRTADIDLSEFGGEGIIKVRGLNTNIVEKVTELQQNLEKEGCTNELLVNLKVSRMLCRLCIIEAPFEITDEVIGEFPVPLVMKIGEVIGELDSKFPLQ